VDVFAHGYDCIGLDGKSSLDRIGAGSFVAHAAVIGVVAHLDE